MDKKGTLTPVVYHTEKLIWAGLQTKQWSILKKLEYICD